MRIRNAYKMKNQDVKKYYDNRVSSNSHQDYEIERWLETPEKRAGFKMQKVFIERFLKKDCPQFSKYLEIGPGPGTWTKFFVSYRPEGIFDLVEISEGMTKQLAKSFAGDRRFGIHNVDFIDFETDREYDFLFSSRAIEYITDKRRLMQKMFSVLDKGGRGLIITKHPHYRRQKVLSQKVAEIHKNQIHPRKLLKLLKSSGFSDIKLHSVSFVFPALRLGWLNIILFWLLSKLPLWSTAFFCESYAVSFRKNDS